MITAHSAPGKGPIDLVTGEIPGPEASVASRSMESRLRWTSDENFTLDDVGYASLARHPEPGRLSIYKPRHAIEQYEALVQA